MSYNGSMELPSGIKPLGNYPLVNAADVYVNDTTRLSDTVNDVDALKKTVGSVASAAEVRALFDKYKEESNS